MKVRRFFELSNDSGPGSTVVPDYPRYDMYFDYWRLLQCEVLPDDFLMNSSLLLKEREAVDFMEGSSSWPIASPKMIEIIRQYSNGNVQMLPVKIVASDGRQVLTDFRVINPLIQLTDCIDCLNSVMSSRKSTSSGILHIITPCYISARIPHDCHIFRCREDSYRLVISQELVGALQEAQITGAYYIPTKSI